MSVSTKTSQDLNELFTKLLFLIQSGFYEYGYCSFYIASSGGNSIEIFANDKTLFRGNDAACQRVFKELLKRLKKQVLASLNSDLPQCGQTSLIIPVYPQIGSLSTGWFTEP